MSVFGDSWSAAHDAAHWAFGTAVAWVHAGTTYNVTGVFNPPMVRDDATDGLESVESTAQVRILAADIAPLAADPDAGLGDKVTIGGVAYTVMSRQNRESGAAEFELVAGTFDQKLGHDEG